MKTSRPPTPFRHAPACTDTATRGTARGTLVASALVTAFALQTGTSAADDTEVYFGQPTPGESTNPNVLFVLDTSGSMGTRDADGITRLDHMKVAVKNMLRQADDLNVGLMKFNSFYGGGPVLYPVTDIDATVCEGSACDGITTSATITDGKDDVEEATADNGRLLVGGRYLEFIDTSPSGKRNGDEDKDKGLQSVGLRFTDLEIPRGATIVDARLDFMAERNQAGGEVTVDIQTENSGDSAPFGNAQKGVSSRPWHISRTQWHIDEKWKQGETYTSENLAGMIQLVTDRADWCGGNALALRIKHSSGTAFTGIRHALTFESASQTQTTGSNKGDAVGDPPTLRVTYKLDKLPNDGGCMRTSSSIRVAQGVDDAEQYLHNNSVLVTGGVHDMPRAGNRQQRIGVRFRGVPVANGATVRKAWIEFNTQSQVRNNKAQDVSVTITGEAADVPTTFARWGNNIGRRTKTSASVVWKDVPNPRAGTTIRTEDITPIVTELVNRSGWKKGNPMVFLFDKESGSGTRALTTFEKNSSRAPRLVIDYEDNDPDLLAGTRTFKVRDELISLVDSFVARGGTPIVDSMWEASQYFRGGPVQFGAYRGTYDQSTNRISHPKSYDGGSTSLPPYCYPNNLNSTWCNSERITGNPVYKSPITSSCQTNHIVFLSDGEAVSNSSALNIRALTGKSSCEASGDEECGAELAEWLYENDLSSAEPNRQNVKTHTIAFNLADTSFLDKLATKGGGNLYEAEDAAGLLGVFRRILDNVNAIDTSFTAPGATVNQFNRLTHRDDIYFAMFKPTDVPRWSGNLKKFRIGTRKDSSGAVGTGTGDAEVAIRDRNDDIAVDASTGFFADGAHSFWPDPNSSGPDGHNVKRGGAANQMALDGLTGIGERRTYTWTGAARNVPTGGVDLTAPSQRLHEDNGGIDETILGITTHDPDADERDEYRTKLLSWARGVDIEDEDQDGSVTDTRHHMGDPMHSRPVILNYADGSDVRSIVYAATNEGYLHAFDTANGQEQFAYMPGELLQNIQVQFENQAADEHLYGLDGHLSIWRSDANRNYIVDGSDKALLFFGMRRGGSKYYALDVTDYAKPKLAWAIEAGTPGFEQLGQSWSRLAPVRMTINGTDEDVLLFGAGYDEAQDTDQVFTDTSLVPDPTSVEQLGRGMYIVRASDGDLLWSGLGARGGSQTFADMRYPIPGNLRAIDVNQDGLVDQIYAADTGGQVWRFDLKQDHQSGNLMEGGVIADLSGSDAADKRRFYSEPDVSLVERGGESFLTISIGSGWRAHPLREDVEDRFYVLRQKDVRTAPGTGNYGLKDGNVYRAITDADLTEVTNELDPTVGEHGWFLDFGLSGEKVLGTSITFDNSVIFSSYVPTASANDCSTGLGGGRAYVLDLLTGAPRRDLDNDKELELEDRSVELKHEGLPPDAMIMLTEDGEDKPTILFGVEQVEGGLFSTGRRTFWSDRGEGEPIAGAAAGDDDSDGGGEEEE